MDSRIRELESANSTLKEKVWKLEHGRTWMENRRVQQAIIVYLIIGGAAGQDSRGGGRHLSFTVYVLPYYAITTIEWILLYSHLASIIISIYEDRICNYQYLRGTQFNYCALSTYYYSSCYTNSHQVKYRRSLFAFDMF